MRVALDREARREIAEGARHYEGEREGLGAEFFDEIRQVLDRIREWPLLYACVPRKPVRKALISHFPYLIYYRVGDDDMIRVIAVVHAARHPRIWRNRT